MDFAPKPTAKPKAPAAKPGPAPPATYGERAPHAPEEAQGPSFFHNHPWMKAEREAQRAAQHMEAVPPSALPDAAPDAPSGVPLPAEARGVLEPRLGGDLSQVRLHTGLDGANAAAVAGARAVTIGSQVSFGAGQYRPGTPEGRQVIGHELAHAVQQAGGGHGLSAVAGPTAQGYCDPTIESCPPDQMVCDEASAPDLPPIEDYSVPSELGMTIEIAGPPDTTGGDRESQLIHLPIPVYYVQRDDIYALPVDSVFATQAEADAGVCSVAPEPGADSSGGSPGEPPPAAPVDPTSPGPTPLSPGPETAAMSGGAETLFLPGQTVYTLDGPIEILSARGPFVFTRMYTKYAVGAGSTTLVLTQNGYVLVDAGMHQVGGHINAALADAIIERLDRDLNGAPLREMMLTHLHNDHRNLATRAFARWEIGTIRLNAIQAFLPGTGGRTQGENFLDEVLEARRQRVEGEVRADLTSDSGPWDMYIDEAARQEALDEAVRAETIRRLQAMPEVTVHLDIPSGGEVVAANMPIGRLALPAGLRSGGGPITEGLLEPGMLTLLHPQAEGMLSDVLGGRMPREGVDAASSMYVIDMPNGARLFVLSDPRIPDLLQSMGEFERQLARLGHPATLQLWDELHHVQRGATEGSAMARGDQLASYAELLARLPGPAQSSSTEIRDVLVVSVHGSPDAPSQPSYVDPSLIWILRSMNYEVILATGGGSQTTAARDVGVVEVVLGEQRMSLMVGEPYPTLAPEEPLAAQAAAAMAQERDTETRLEAELRGTLTADERAETERQLGEARARYTALHDALARYNTAVMAEIGRGPRSSRSAVEPPIGGNPPAIEAADALRALLTGYTTSPSSEGAGTGGSLVVLGPDEMSRLTTQGQLVLATRTRVQELAAGLRASSPVEDRNALVSALDVYRTELLALRAAAPAEMHGIIDHELGLIDQDVSRHTGWSPAQIEEVREATRLADQVDRNAIRPMIVENPTEMTQPERVREAISSHGGQALMEGRLYELAETGGSVSIRPVPLVPVSTPRTLGTGGTGGGETGGESSQLPVPIGPAPLQSTRGGLPGLYGGSRSLVSQQGPIVVPGPVPAEFIGHPNIINFSGRPIYVGGTVLEPTAWGPITGLRPGDLVIRGSSSSWILTDPVTGRPIAGAFYGGEWLRVEADGRLTLEIDSQGNVQRAHGPRTIVGGGYGTQRVASPEAATGRGYGRGTQAVAVGVGIIVLANEVLGQLGQIRQVQRHNLEVRRARMELWARFGALRAWEMRTSLAQEVQPFGTEADTSMFGDPVYHYVTEIDTEALREALLAAIGGYQDLMLWIDMAVTLGAVEVEGGWLMPAEPTAEDRARPRRYWAKIDGAAGTNAMSSIEITTIIQEIEQRELAEIGEEMTARVAGWSETERANIYRLASGSETRVYRSANGQRIMSAGHTFGPDPLVRPVGRTYGDDLWERVVGWNHLHGTRILVEPANADAQRTALLASYMLLQDIEDTLAEVQDAGRPIIERVPPEGEGMLQSFVAGPAPGDARFGDTRYFRHQQEPYRWTIAIGQLNQFWVDEDELRPLTPEPAAPAEERGTSLDPDRLGITPPVHGTVERSMPGRIETNAESVTYNPSTGVVTGRRMQ